MKANSERIMRFFGSRLGARLIYILALILPLCHHSGLISEAVAQAGFYPPSSRRFFSEDFVVFGVDENGRDFLLTVMLCRKEEEGKQSFMHYGFASLITDGVNVEESRAVSDSHVQEIPNGFLLEYNARGPEDLSTRDSYFLRVLLGGKEIELKLPEVGAEFMVKANPDYTKFVGEGAAEVKLNGKVLQLRASVERIYAADYSLYVFFPGHGKINSESHVLTLWDEIGNFYLIDTSRVEEANPSYRSHTWVLWKDTTKGLLKKGYRAHLSFTDTDSEGPRWKLSLPGIEMSKMELQRVQSKKNKPNEGVVRGEVEINGQRRKVGGFYEHHVYPPK